MAQVYVDTDGNVLQKAISTVNTVESGNLHSVTSNAVAGALGQWVTIYAEGDSFIKGCKMKWGTLLRFRFSGYFGNYRATQYIPNGYNLYTIPEGWRPVTHNPNRFLIAVDTTSIRMTCGININTNGNMNMYFEGNVPLYGGVDNVTGLFADILFLLQ